MQNSLLTKGYISSMDIPAHHAVMFDTAGLLTVTSDIASKAIGVSGEVSTSAGVVTDVIHVGIASIVLSETVQAGASLSATNAGTAELASSGQHRLGIALEAGNNGDIIPILVTPMDVS